MSEDLQKQKILMKIIELEITNGHLKWKTTDLAKLTGFSRPLLYYHFGQTKKEILRFAISSIGDSYFALRGPRAEMAANGQLVESLIQTRELLNEYPMLAVFYQKWRAVRSEIQDQLIAIENRYQEKLQSVFPHLTHDGARAVHGLFHGLVTSPFLTDADVRSAFIKISNDYRL